MTAPPPLNTLFQRNPIQHWNHVDSIFGDKFHDLNGIPIYRNKTLSFHGLRLPALLDNLTSIVYDTPPDTSLASDLSVLLTKESLRALQRALFPQTHGICQLCGQHAPPLKLQELWQFHYPSQKLLDELSQDPEILVFGLQRLENLLLICDPCHKCFHLNRAKLDGTLPETLHRLQSLNHWDRSTLEAYVQALQKRFLQSSNIHWMLDLEKIHHPHGGITIRPPWIRYQSDPSFIAAHSNQKLHSHTQIFGIPWRLHSEHTWTPLLPVE